ncbi:MAG: CDP-archaeol synthase [Verrucomicrobia bacterium]|nr:CDP-archaeol synthase [Verrucomicrobiota bacterium]
MLNLRKMNDLSQRLLLSGTAIIIVALLIFFSYHPIVNILLVLTIATITGVAIWEYAQMAKSKGLQPASKLMIAVAVFEVIAFYISSAYPEFSKLALLIIILGFISFFIAHFKETSNALLNIAVEFFGVCYIALPFSFMMAILYPFSSQYALQDGRWWLFYLITVTKVTDIGGYFAGKLWGSRPLARQLSPKKTVEGAIGGFVSAVLLSVIYSLLSQAFSMSSFHLGLIHAIWIGMVIGVLAQIGDLAESLLKRDAVVKDSNSIPGVGGILDMVDSLLFTSPVVYFFIRP